MLSVHGCPLARPGTRDAGGMQMYVRALSRELARRGIAVDVFTRRTDSSLPAVVPFAPGARVVHVDAGEPTPMDKNAVVDVLPEFVCNVKRFQRDERLTYDVIHSHYWLSGWVGNLLARRWEIPHVTMFHTLGRLKNRALADQEETEARIRVEEHVVGAADRIVASSEHERQALVEQYGARRERVSVINGGVDLGLFRPGNRVAARSTLGIPPGDEVILFVGRMDRVKGLDVLLRAMALLKQRPRIRLVVVGGSDQDAEMERCRALAAELEVDVSFRGASPQESLPTYYSAADLLVVPSHYESFGLVAVEALACGTPVIASRVGGLPTVIDDGENGLLVPSRRPDAFAERIERFLDDRPLRSKLSANARPSVIRYSWEFVAARVTTLYQEVASAPVSSHLSLEGLCRH